MPIFSVSELLNIAIKDEETGIAFYEALAEGTKDPDLKEHIKHIARQEQYHAQRFREMLDDVGDFKPQERYTGEYESYLNAVLEARAFPGPAAAAEEARSAADDASALQIAMRLEKDTLLFLNEIKHFLPETHEEYIDAVIKEEREHLVELTNLTKKLKK